MKFKIRFANQIVGLFIILSLAGLVALLIAMGANQRWFAINYNYTSRFDAANGLNVGMSLRHKGFEIGKTTGIALLPDGEVELSFYVQDTYLYLVRPYSVIELQTSPLGLGSSLVFYPGLEEADPLPAESFIPSYTSRIGQNYVKAGRVDLPRNADQISRIINQVEPLLGSVNGLVQNLDATLSTVQELVDGTSTGPVSALLADSSSIVAQLEAALGGLLGQTSSILVDAESIAGNIEQTTAELRDPTGLVPRLLDPSGSLDTLLNDEDQLFGQITAILASLNRTAVQVEELSVFLNSTQPQLSGLLEETRSAIDTGQDVLEGVRNNPLIRGGIQETSTQATTFQSVRDEGF